MFPNLDFRFAEKYNIDKGCVGMRNSKTTKELYEKLLEMPDLHSKPLNPNLEIIWNAYVKAYILIQ